mgnify:CR=1 FL=1
MSQKWVKIISRGIIILLVVTMLAGLILPTETSGFFHSVPEL